jgi:hypothetical protein
MKDLDKLSISQVVWYLLPGLACLFFLSIPTAFFNIDLFVKILNSIGAVGIIIVSIVLGFIMDGLRLYRYRPRYKKIKKDFQKQITSVLGPEKDSYYIFWKVSKYASKNGYEQIPFLHAFWIFLAQITFLCWLDLIFWLGYSIYLFITKTGINILGYVVAYPTNLILCIGITIIFLIVGLILLSSSIEDQLKTNKMFMELINEHKDKIKAT